MNMKLNLTALAAAIHKRNGTIGDKLVLVLYRDGSGFIHSVPADKYSIDVTSGFSGYFTKDTKTLNLDLQTAINKMEQVSPPRSIPPFITYED